MSAQLDSQGAWYTLGVMHAGRASSVESSKAVVDVRFELSLALHSAVARALNEEVLELARARVDEWLKKGGSSVPLLERWRAILAMPIESVRAVLTDRSEDAAWLRKASPFAGSIPPRERERILRETRRRLRSLP